jgi:hypothetical protein
MKTLLMLTALLIAAFNTNAGQFDSGKLESVAALSTTDNSTNLLTTIAVPSNTVIRVEARILGKGDGYGCTYGKAATFGNTNGVAFQIGSTTTTATATSDPAFTSIIDAVPDGSGARVRVAGATGKPLNWTAYITVFYAP